MKFIVDNKHREFFNDNGWIEFEGIVSPEKIHEVYHAVSNVLARRLVLEKGRLDRVPTDALYLNGHDVWRDNEIVKNFVCQRLHAEIAANLVEAVPLRLAYDQVIMSGFNAAYLPPPALKKTLSLEQCSSMQGLLCGFLIALESSHPEEPRTEFSAANRQVPLPRCDGSAIFLAPDVPIDFTQLFATPACTYLLVVYSKAVTRYVHCDDDLHTHTLKNFGYGFGDKLVDLHHPVLFR